MLDRNNSHYASEGEEDMGEDAILLACCTTHETHIQ